MFVAIALVIDMVRRLPTTTTTTWEFISTEKNYAHNEKECLAIISRMEKWHQYLYGRHVITVHTDHEPLETIFKKLLCNDEWCSSYKDINFQFDTRKERNFTLSTLSRAPVTYHPSTTSARKEYEVFRMELAEMDIEPNRVTPEAMQRITQETAKDPVLASLYSVITSGWPAERKETPEQLRQYWSFRDDISVYDGVAYRSHQGIVPSSLWVEMLQKIHKAHQGADSSISRSRESLF